jgi:hypothetical protein
VLFIYKMRQDLSAVLLSVLVYAVETNKGLIKVLINTNKVISRCLSFILKYSNFNTLFSTTSEAKVAAKW